MAFRGSWPHYPGPPPKPSPLLRLPLRLLIRLLLFFDYKTLLRVRVVSRRLKTIVAVRRTSYPNQQAQVDLSLAPFCKSSIFDAALFRLAPPQPPRKLRTYQLHPLLQAVDCATVTHQQARIWRTGCRFPCTSHEYATSPACVRLVVHTNEARVGVVEKAGGVEGRRGTPGVREVLAQTGFVEFGGEDEARAGSPAEGKGVACHEAQDARGRLRV